MSTKQLKRMPDGVADELDAVRRTAVYWAKTQYAEMLAVINTGQRDTSADYRKSECAGNAAIERIVQIKREYPSK